MDDKTFDSLSEFSRKLSFPQGLSIEQIIRGVGNGFKANDRLTAITAVISQRIHKGTKPTHRFSSTENFINCGKKLTAKLNATERFYLFVLMMYGWHLELSRDAEEIKATAQILDIDANELRLIHNFFNQSQPFIDTDSSVYFVNPKTNPLISARGVNVEFKLPDENEIHYLKYIKERNLFLIKIFSSHRPNNSITELITVKQINILSPGDAFIQTYSKSFESLVKSTQTFFPFQTVKCEAGANTPSILLDATLSKIVIKGSSSPLSPINYFQPILEWIESFGIHGGEALEVEVALDYFNSYTLKFLLNLCYACKSLSARGRDINIKWFYEDEEILDFGQQLQEIYGDKFQLIKIQNKAGALL